jgi:hypothetical protein
MQPNGNALQNVMSQISQGGKQPGQPPQPGERTDMLLSALKALQTYQKTTMQADPQDPDLKLVRQLIVSLSDLVKKDQMEDKQGGSQSGMHQMPDGSMMPNSQMPGGTGGDIMQGAPQMPDLSSILGGANS